MTATRTAPRRQTVHAGATTSIGGAQTPRTLQSPRIGNAVRAPRAVSQACLGSPPSQAALEQLAAANA
ncbi:hypothetical protein XAP6164_5220008 [Xanthomonas phaseoli pv. phaseoli]|nr:hypothetical protein XAP6164_5220008 [Xanthomonas phaseoli pv. phaseoli]